MSNRHLSLYYSFSCHSPAYRAAANIPGATVLAAMTRVITVYVTVLAACFATGGSAEDFAN